eukprot:4613510-Alexandrium_andersonii.AAC.1
MGLRGEGSKSERAVANSTMFFVDFCERPSFPCEAWATSSLNAARACMLESAFFMRCWVALSSLRQ